VDVTPHVKQILLCGQAIKEIQMAKGQVDPEPDSHPPQDPPPAGQLAGFSRN
jgi:hypothetical protein